MLVEFRLLVVGVSGCEVRICKSEEFQFWNVFWWFYDVNKTNLKLV